MPFSFTAAQSCGDFIYTYDYGDGLVEERESIADCSNPFGLSDEPKTSSINVVVGDNDVQNGSVVTVAALPANLTIEIDTVPEEYVVFSDLVRHEGADYQYLAESVGSAFEFSATGTYSLVTQVQEPFSVSASPSVWQRIQQVFIPVAHAQIIIAPATELFVTTFTVQIAPPQPTGASSVLFLPGIQASRLYAGEDIVLPGLPNNVDRGDTLWEQTNDKRIALLAMDETGQSVYDIYTQDVVEEITGSVFGANIYKGFLQMLEDLKTDVEPDTGTTTIANYLPFAYDWRYSVFDVATQPVQYENDTKLLKDEVIRLADDSHTEKVTIVAHSNGGLVAKALLHEYGDNELQGKIDKVVMIGTPQLGTPKGVSALLHGQVMEGFGDFLTSDAILRDTIVNMPGTYTLLPSVRYLVEVANEPLVKVAEGFNLRVYDGVSTRSELDTLLLDTQSVVGTAPSIEEPLQLNGTLLQNALAEQDILDSWQPPAGVEVYEVAGTGIPTPAAIHYEAGPVVTCPNAAAVFFGTQCEVTTGLKPKLQTTTKGDKTVVLGSARGQLGDKRTLTVNLVEEGDGVLAFEREHADLTESSAVQTFVESVIRFPYMSDDIITPEFSQLLSGYTIYAGHSPVTLRVTTPDGLITGIVDGEIREDIPGSQFLTLGGSSYVIAPDDVTDYTLEVIGTGNGVYTLETNTLSPDDVQTVIDSFVASTTDTMIATMEVAGGSMGTLQTDFDGDGVVDEVRTATGDLIVTEIVDEEMAVDSTSESRSSATRVGGRTPAAQVLGVSVSVQALTPEQHEQLQGLLGDIQQILDKAELTPEQLVVLSEVLDNSLSIIGN